MKKAFCGRPAMRAMVLAVSLVISVMYSSAEDARAADTIQTIVTNYQPTITETIDASGFKHPGIGLTKDVLENMRAKVLAQKEPWNTHFNQMLLSSAASKTITSNNQSTSDPTKPGTLAFNSQGVEAKFIADALKSYTQAILYYVTGDETYRANALRLIRIWSQMDPSQYVYYADAHIHTGIPLNRMVAAAEILRYTSCQTASLQWTDQDTQNFTTNLITPVIETFQHKNTYFMNQHLYPLIGAMSGYIFTGNRARYNEGVEWFTVNKTAVDQGQNGAIKPLFRLVTKNDLTGEAVTPVVQHVEMGRDQAHGAGDVTNISLLARLLISQDTKVDPVEGTPSTAPDAVGPYEFLNDRVLDATEYFAHYMLGYDTPWVPTAAHTDANGVPTIVYKQLASDYRGRLTQNTWEPYYYYKYARGLDLDQRAPSFTKMYSERVSYNWDGVDGGGDFWILMPSAAEAEGTKYLVRPIVDPIREVEDRFTSLDSMSAAAQDDTASFVRVNATSAGTKIALVGYANSTKNLAFRIRTNGDAVLDVFGDTIVVPDTKGQWRYVTHSLNMYQSLTDLVYVTIRGAGTTVDIDHLNLNAATAFTPPVFNSGASDVGLYTTSGSSAAVSFSFAATDANPSAVLTYQVDNLPPGANFDPNTGAFTWQPSQAGTYSFVVTASDGTVVTSKNAKIVVSADRNSAIAAASGAYNPAIVYTSTTLTPYNTAYADAVNSAATATDDQFNQKLATLGAAATALKQLTPLLSDGSMDYSNMLVSSTFGTSVPNALDGSPTTYVVYTQAQNLTHYFDFGPSYRISADSFQLQVRASFPDRIGGVAIFGSNDNQTWIRLTPGQTIVTEDMQALDVQSDLRSQRFRFLKMQMVQPSSSMLEVAEFRIFGKRYETVNQLSSVSISSDQSLRSRILTGNTVKLTFQATAPINGVMVTIQGQPAQVSSSDNLNWTATAVMNGDAAAGPVKFQLNYKTASGADADPVQFTTDASSLFIADQTGYIDNLLNITSLSDSNGRNPTDLLAAVGNLLDSNLGSFTDFRLNGNGAGGYLTFDFKDGNFATLSRVEVIPRQDQYYTRIKGTIVQGSNDNTTWNTITPAAASTLDWQTLAVNSVQPYRYIRVTNASAWYGNMAELRLYGAVNSTNKISTVSMSSPQAMLTRIVPGNQVKLTFTAKEAISNVNVTIQGQSATVTTSDNINFTAVATLNQGAAPGAVSFAISYKQQNGNDGFTNTSTTDSTGLVLVDESDVIRNLPAIATLIDSTVGRTASVTATQVNNLTDANLGTISDFRTGATNTGVGSYITFDFKAGNQVNLSSVEMVARQDSNYARIKGTVIQGSNDNTNWTTLTNQAASTMAWQTLAINNAVPYRYIRVYNSGTWFGNMAELRLHGSVHGADVTPPTTADNAPQGWTNKDTTVTLNATDSGSSIAGTYFKVDGGAQQTGNVVLIGTEGTHTITYWSADVAGNVEQQHNVSVKIDKTAPTTTGTPSPTVPASGWYTGPVSVTLAASDTASGVASTWYTIDGSAPQSGSSLALGTKGKHMVTFWSIDQAGTVETQHSLSVNIGPIDVTNHVKLTQQGATLNRATGKYVGAVTVTNIGTTALGGIVWLKLDGLTSGVTLDNAGGLDGGAPYVVVSGSLNPGATINVPLTFSNPSRGLISYTPSFLATNS